MEKYSSQSLAYARKIVAEINAASEFGAFDSEFGSRLGRSRLDADETITLALQLEQMRTRIYEAQYPELKGRGLFPLTSDIDPGAQSFSWTEEDHRGSFKQIADNGGFTGDLPSVGIESSKQTRQLYSYGGIAHYSLQDLRRASLMGKPLETRLMMALRKAWEEKLDSLIAIGDPSVSGWTGAANRPTGTGATQTRSTTFTTADFAEATKDPDNMIDQLHRLVREYVVDSKETLVPTHLALPLHIYMRLATTYFTDVQGGTVLNRFTQDNPFVKTVVSWDHLRAARNGNPDSNSLDRALLWRQDSDVCETVIAQDFEMLPPEKHLFQFQVPAHARTAGFVVFRPMGLRYATALPAT